MVNRSVVLLVAIILLGGLLGSCAARGAGPQAWIDTPLDNTVLPLAPVTIIAHASAEHGVVGIEFTVDDGLYRSVTADGERLVWREIEWTPPGAGTYLIGARGLGTNGATGATVTARVTISEDAAPEGPIPEPESLPGPVPQAEALPVQPPQPEHPTVMATVDANCREGPATSYAAYGTLLRGQKADLVGRLADNSWLWVLLEGRSKNCWIAASVVETHGGLDSVQVVAAPQPPPSGEQPPAADVLPPAPVEVDTTPPSFFSAAVQPTTILKAGSGCPSHARTVKVAAAVGDDGGLSAVTAYWTIDGVESGQVVLALGGLGYWAMIGPVNNTGSMNIHIVATDTSGNSAQSQTFVVTVNECIG